MNTELPKIPEEKEGKKGILDGIKERVSKWSKKKKIIVGVIVAFLLMGLFSNLTSPVKEIPNVKDMTVSEAVAKISKNDFDTIEVEDEDGNIISEEDYGKYKVLKTDPSGEAKTITTINVIAKKTDEQIAKEKQEKEEAEAQKKAEEAAKKEQEELDKAEQERISNPDLYKTSCIEVPYEELMRNPTSYMAKDIAMTGKIMQVTKDSAGDKVYLVQVTQDGYGYWDDIVIVGDVREDQSSNFIEEDIIRFYGMSLGTTDYTTAIGSEKTVPFVGARFIDMQG